MTSHQRRSQTPAQSPLPRAESGRGGPIRFGSNSARAQKLAGGESQAMLDAQKRVGQHLLRDEPVAFALALAAMSQKQARFVIGRPGEMILQLLYRPSIRYTIAGLKFDGAGNAAHNAWQAYIRATENRDSDEAARVVLTMLRDIHLPVLEKEAEANF